MKNLLLSFLFIAFSVCGLAQNNDTFYATMNVVDAKALEKDIPNGIQILATKGNEAAVLMTPAAAHKLHDRILVHGPGYMFKASKTDALAALGRQGAINTENLMPFTITEDATVAEVLEVINVQNIEDHILELQAYGTRFHTRPEAIQAAQDLKVKWESMAAQYNRNDVSVRLFNHTNTNMPSVIMTIAGSETPEEFVVVGGHLDSTSNQGNNNAPGADDDASGIATITEATRALFEIGFVPKRTIEVMAYAAEEIGLVGSAEIAEEYASNNVNVIAVGQFDMTLFNGSATDVSLISDFTNANLNTFFMDLMDHYNATGDHQITYGTSLCNYGCSDHASWTAEGYMASFPFEASFGQHNGNIHTSNDTFSVTGTASHATKFTKLCAEFLIETAKGNELLSVHEATAKEIFVTVQQNKLHFDVSASKTEFELLSVFDTLGKKVLSLPIAETKGEVPVASLSQGVYIVTLASKTGVSVSKKVIKE
ncbi:M20/M25/M40 family metallo-hydrolase [Marinirhabdus gelatinilytica]|uniref:Carboxypeptidase Q n=1 Tax=Marinirhabdus gelatinilytica TaxID=1703343 RepID=A0A370Q7D9_9FLAO|nr:M20/M25/M40 family metallo-hydrolase [Marinirhabdus gelatinilytica]RDK84266.1 leucyl aminopeptidase [Marinirhabdus gelatinilytica]